MNFQITTLNVVPPSAHPDLLWQRYLVPNPDKDGKFKASLEEWKRVTAFQPGAVYSAAYGRWKRALTSKPDMLLHEAKVEGRLLTGSGLASVFETALLLHPVYGVPYLSGSSLRGALRAALAVTHPTEAATLFGSEPQPSGTAAESITAGYISVFDALWVPGSSRTPLSLDVLTVHHPDYYGGTGAPTDFDQPTPVNFITGRGKFLFALQAPNAEWKEYVRKLLEFTLRFRGVGAKKSAGYGRFLSAAPPLAPPA